MLNINKINIQLAIHSLAVANNVTDAQMAAYVFRNFYTPVNRMSLTAKIRRHSVTISNWALEI